MSVAYGRLNRTKDIHNVYKSGRRNMAPGGIFFIYAKNSEHISRFCVIAKKRKFRRAVDRNRLKRLMRSAINKNFCLQDSYDIIVGYSRDNIVPSYDKIEKDIIFLLDRIN